MLRNKMEKESLSISRTANKDNNIIFKNNKESRLSEEKEEAEANELGDVIQRLQNFEASLEYSLQSNLKAIVGEDNNDINKDGIDNEDYLTDDDGDGNKKNFSRLGPIGKGILGVDYLEHVVSQTDTLQGICLLYKIPATKLRQANHFSGNSLLLAPKRLVIPISKKAMKSGCIRVQDTDAKESKIHAFRAEFSYLSFTEAKAYLESAKWILQDAIQSAREDGKWERREEEETKDDAAFSKNNNVNSENAHLKPGEIRLTMHPVRGKKSMREMFWIKAHGAGFGRNLA